MQLLVTLALLLVVGSQRAPLEYATLSDVKEFYTPGQVSPIREPLVVSVLVVANNDSGNFPNRLVVQDVTGGIELSLESKSGQELGLNKRFDLNVEGLFISNSFGVLQLGSAPSEVQRTPSAVGPLSTAELRSRITRLSQLPAPINPKSVTIASLSPADASTLVKICGVEFSALDSSATFVKTDGQRAVNQVLTDCGYNTLAIRTEAAARFRAADLPACGGCITGIYSPYKDQKQLKIRDLNDLAFDGDRCMGSPCGENPATNPSISQESLLSLKELRSSLEESSKPIEIGKFAQGTVIEDGRSGTTDPRNLIIQDRAGSGVVVRLYEEHAFKVGDELRINLSGGRVQSYNGVVQLANLPLAAVDKLGKLASPQPRRWTVQDIVQQADDLQSTLIRVESVALRSDSKTWERASSAADATGAITVYTRPQASFSGTRLPTDTVDIVGYVTEYKGEPQIIVRSLDDVAVSGGAVVETEAAKPVTQTRDGTSMLKVDFESQQDRQDVALAQWQNVSTVAGGRRWQARSYKGNMYAQATAYGDQAASMDAWLISPLIDFEKNLQLSMRIATSYFKHDGLEIATSTDYDGSSNPLDASWQSLSIRMPNAETENNRWIGPDSIILNGLSGTGYLAIRYRGDGRSRTSTFRVDDVLITTP